MIKKHCSSTRSIVEKVEINSKFKLLYLPSGEGRPSDRRRDTVDWRKPPENNLWKQSLQWMSKKLHCTWKQSLHKTKSVPCSLEIVSWVWQSTVLHLHCLGKLLENILNLFSDLLSDRCEYTSTIRLTFWDIQCYGMIFGSPPHWWTCTGCPFSAPQWCLPKLLEKRTHIWKARQSNQNHHSHNHLHQHSHLMAGISAWRL